MAALDPSNRKAADHGRPTPDRLHVLRVNDNDRLLLSRRHDTDPDFDGLWHLPSGKLDAGEPATEAAAREVHEEVGLLVEPDALTHVHTMHVNGSGPNPVSGCSSTPATG